MKAYLGVYFNNKSSWDIIPKRWLITNEEKLQCYWPPKDAGDLQTLARNSCAPKKHWEVYDINKIETSSDDYDRAFSKMTNIDVATTSSEAEMNQQLVVAKRRLDFAVPSTSSKRPNTDHNKNTIQDEIVEETTTDEDDVMPAARPLPRVTLKDTSHFIPQTSEAHPESSAKMMALMINMSERLDQIEKVVKINNNLEKEKLMVIRELYEKLTENQPNTTEGPPANMRPNPATTIEELNMLTSDNNIIGYITDDTELTLSRTITKMLKILMTRELGMAFSLTGMGRDRSHPKLAFIETRAFKLIEHVILKSSKFSQASLTEIRRAVSNSLKNCSDWDGNRGPRRSAPANVEPQREEQQQQENEVEPEVIPGILQESINILNL